MSVSVKTAISLAVLITTTAYATTSVLGVNTGVNARSLTHEQIQSRLKSLGHTEISVDYTTYDGVNRPCKFIDSEYGEWWATPSNVLRKGSRHPKRHNTVRGKCLVVPVSEIKSRLKDKFGGLVTIDESTYKSGKEKARFIDAVHGEFWCRPDQIPYILGHPLRGLARKGQTLKHSFEEAYTAIQEKWGSDVQLIEYSGYNEKARFLHNKYGEWTATFCNVLKGHCHPLAGVERYKATMKQLYGAEHPSQSAEIHKRMVAGRGQSLFVRHWKSGEQMCCTASYEYAVLNRLNELKEDYSWQIRFELGLFDGIERVYFCDLYLPSKNLYVEIKGRFIGELNKQKWERFHDQHPNSELWLLPQVTAFTGKTAHHLRKDFRAALLDIA